MKPLPISADNPHDIDKDFSITWNQLIVSGLEMESEIEFEYLVEIKKYCNNSGMPDGICGKMFEYRSDAEFERLLSFVHYLPALGNKFITHLFVKTGIRDFLKEFHEDETELQNALEKSEFHYLDSFQIEGELSSYLYRYGMYDFFYKHNTAERAREISIDFMKHLFENDLDNVICFQSFYPWGKWFDIHSCSDRTFVFLNKRERMIWLFCFSHSD